jgi:predicted PurR-regulated permease PerM
MFVASRGSFPRSVAASLAMIKPRPMSDAGSDRMFPRWIVVVAIVGAVGLLLYALRGALTPVFFAFLIAYMLDPVVDRFEARNIPRAVGIAVMLTLVLGAMSLFVLFAVPGIIADVVGFVREVPASFGRLRAQYEPVLLELGVPVPDSFEGAMDQFRLGGEELSKALAPAGAVAKWLLGGTVDVMVAAAGLLVVPVFAAYLLHDFDRITAGIRDLVPSRWRPFVVDIAREVDVVLGEFIRGQLLVMLILAVLYSVAYAILDVRLAVLIGVTAGLLSFIPYVGGATALGLAVLMCLLDWGGWGQMIGVVVAYSVIQTVESFFITPRIVGEKVGLPAVWVLFALVVGGDLFGFMGVLLALPAAAVIKIFVVRGVEHYRTSAFFTEDRTSGAQSSGPRGLLRGILEAEGLPDDEAGRRAKARRSPDAAPDEPPTSRGDAPEPSPGPTDPS